jgi:hypothetical protein
MTMPLQLQPKQPLQTVLQAQWNKQMNRYLPLSYSVPALQPNSPASRRDAGIPFNCYNFTAADTITADITIFTLKHTGECSNASAGIKALRATPSAARAFPRKTQQTPRNPATKRDNPCIGMSLRAKTPAALASSLGRREEEPKALVT